MPLPRRKLLELRSGHHLLLVHAAEGRPSPTLLGGESAAIAACPPAANRFSALRDQAWLAASDSCDRWSVPFDAAVEQESQAVVLEVAEAVADPFDLFDQQVHGFGWPVG